MVSVFVEVALLHVPFPVAVRVSVILPAVISAALGVYVQRVSELGFAKVPVPLDVQVTPVLFIEPDPAVIFTAPELEQVVIAVPATAVGAAVIVSAFADVVLVQPAFATAVNVSVTPPAVISAALGV